MNRQLWSHVYLIFLNKYLEYFKYFGLEQIEFVKILYSLIKTGHSKWLWNACSTIKTKWIKFKNLLLICLILK